MPDKSRSACPIASFLDLFGDRWTLLIVRDLLCGKARFADFEASPERIPASILADRMRRLVAQGVVMREAYQSHPTRFAYRLTETGRALHPALVAMGAWSEAHLPDVWNLPQPFRDGSLASLRS